MMTAHTVSTISHSVSARRRALTAIGTLAGRQRSSRGTIGRLRSAPCAVDRANEAGTIEFSTLVIVAANFQILQDAGVRLDRRSARLTHGHPGLLVHDAEFAAGADEGDIFDELRVPYKRLALRADAGLKYKD